jgi:hypothetical protein
MVGGRDVEGSDAGQDGIGIGRDLRLKDLQSGVESAKAPRWAVLRLRLFVVVLPFWFSRCRWLPAKGFKI